MPFVNDTEAQIDEWINLCKRIGVENLADDFEGYFAMQYPKSIPPKVPTLLEYIYKRAEEEGMNICRFRYAYQLMHELEVGSKKIANSERNLVHQKKFVEKMLQR